MQHIYQLADVHLASLVSIYAGTVLCMSQIELVSPDAIAGVIRNFL